MTTDSLEPFEGNGTNDGGNDVPPDAAPQELPTAAVLIAPAEELPGDPAVAQESDPDPLAAPPTPPPPSRRWFRRGLPRKRPSRVASGRRRLAGFAVAFVVGAAVVVLLLCAAAFGLSNTYRDRVLPGVRAGSVDLSGLTRDQAMAKLKSDYAYLGNGLVTITTPVGTATITYEQAGRGPDVEAIADAAMAVGHSGNPLADGASVVHFAAFGQDIPVVVQIDPIALAERIHVLDRTTTVAPQDAQATARDGNFSFTAGATGQGIDEMAMASVVIEQLTQPGAAPDLQTSGRFETLEPRVSDKDAMAAIARAWKMVASVDVTWTTPPAGAPASWKPQDWQISTNQIRGWIFFGIQPDGTYGPTLDRAQMEAYLADVSGKAGVAPVEPGIVWDASGKPVDLTAGKDGLGVDPVGTASAVSAHLDALAAGGSAASSVEIVTGPIHPQITSIDSLADMVVIGSHKTTFFPDISNGNGKNIRQPAANFNGQVINPGQQFSFLGNVGPIDAAHGFTMGGVILKGLSNHTGAMGGGICSASTTMFNAAATAGLKIDERHAHEYYISRYPIGRDATVYSNGVTTYDLKWTNDTPYPIVIRAWTTPGSKSTITIQLWSWPLGRTVAWTGGGMGNVVHAVENPPEYTTKLPAGQTVRAEYATNGFDTGVTRVVTDSSGTAIHNDAWYSHYVVVNGQLQIGGSPPAPPAPEPTPTPTPTPTPAVELPPAV
jgi:vancomycin resistance protein YoaR